MITFLEFTEVLKFDSDVLRQTKFSIYERWSIAQERSLCLQSQLNLPTDGRKSYISKNTYAKCEEVLQEIKETNWSRTYQIL